MFDQSDRIVLAALVAAWYRLTFITSLTYYQIIADKGDFQKEIKGNLILCLPVSRISNFFYFFTLRFNSGIYVILDLT